MTKYELTPIPEKMALPTRRSGFPKYRREPLSDPEKVELTKKIFNYLKDRQKPLNVPGTQEIASGTGFINWTLRYSHGPIVGRAQTENETHRIYVDGNPVLLRLQKFHQREGEYTSFRREGEYTSFRREGIYNGIPIADHQVYVHGTIERESPMGEGMNYSVKPISKDSELARKVIDCARQLFPSFSGELYFHE